MRKCLLVKTLEGLVNGKIEREKKRFKMIDRIVEKDIYTEITNQNK